jgi:hypothetical protein
LISQYCLLNNILDISLKEKNRFVILGNRICKFVKANNFLVMDDREPTIWARRWVQYLSEALYPNTDLVKSIGFITSEKAWETMYLWFQKTDRYPKGFIKV